MYYFSEETNAYSNISPSEEERAFELSDTDEMSENGIQTLPRGIVNPNYPGFQHLAHTLQVKHSPSQRNLESAQLKIGVKEKPFKLLSTYSVTEFM